ncbi:MAG: hypothetical protein JO277_09965, partial [Candidatus Eremiobacteraeota bacterium]|nr:hypothetical protein [Candidatus Eremiobacteraeota bacterium]
METTAEKLNGHNMNGYSKGRRGRSAVKMAKGVLPEEARPEAAKDDLSKVKPISIPAISVAVIEVTCVGTSPLIVKAWSKQAREDMLRAQQGLPVVKRRKNPDAEFLGCRYLNKKKQDYLPGHIVKKCLASAGELVGVRRSLLEKTLFVLDDEVIIQSK